MTAANGEQSALLAAADGMLLVSALLAEPDAVRLAEWQALVADAGNLATDAPIRAALEGLHQALVDADAWVLQDEYVRLFHGATPCPVNETAYVRRDKGAILADIAGFLSAFGLAMRDGPGEKADHLAAELELAAALCVLAVRAVDENRAEELKVSRDALDAFVFSHLGDWLPAFCDRLTLTTSQPVYRALAAVAASVWESAVTTLNLPAGEAAGPAAPDDDGTPYECGLAEAPAEVPVEFIPRPV